jgi:hypothetical protein
LEFWGLQGTDGGAMRENDIDAVRSEVDVVLVVDAMLSVVATLIQ